jgi:hypothetical protein
MRFDRFALTRRLMPLLALAAAAAAGCGRADSPLTSAPVAPLAVVTGAVRDTSGVAIAGATVTLEDTHGAPAPMAARRAAPLALQHGVLQQTTDAGGRYTFEPVPPGDYVLTGSAGGHRERVVPVTLVTEGDPNTPDTTAVDIELTPL